MLIDVAYVNATDQLNHPHKKNRLSIKISGIIKFAKQMANYSWACT
ncbi:hypothetical protein GCM10027424_06550 [Psychrobacter pacificensis]